MTAHDDPLRLVINKLERLADLSDADRTAVSSLPLRITTAPAARYLVREYEEVSECCVLLEGFACRHKTTSEGGRQIVSFHLPGDILDVQHVLFPRADHNVQTITEATIAWVPSAALKKIVQQHPAIGEALWRDTLIDASIFREWVLNVGRRDARTRIAHMLCEIAARLNAAGAGPPESFTLPMSQEQIADATGLTNVHVNRMLQELGSMGVIARDRREVKILDWDRMRAVADFDASYLHAAAA
jgi:CRP-like cAMP-binding protein